MSQRQQQPGRAEARAPATAAPTGPRIAVVGPCASGKSTLVRHLRAVGLDARMPAQEHSEIPEMWYKLLKPDFLVALDAANEALRARRPDVDLSDDYLATERERLAHARAHAGLTLDTTDLSPTEVFARVAAWLRECGVVVANDEAG